MTEAVVYMAFLAVIRHLGLKLTLIYQSKRKLRMKKALIGQNGTSTTILKVVSAMAKSYVCNEDINLYSTSFQDRRSLYINQNRW